MTREDWWRRPGRSSSWIRRSTRYAIYARDRFACVYCGADDRLLTLDHVVPRCDGGSHAPINLVTACLECNTSKQHLPALRVGRVHDATRRELDRRLGRLLSEEYERGNKTIIQDQQAQARQDRRRADRRRSGGRDRRPDAITGRPGGAPKDPGAQ